MTSNKKVDNYLMKLNSINPCLSFFWCRSSQIPHAVTDTDIKATFIKLMGLKQSQLTFLASCKIIDIALGFLHRCSSVFLKISQGGSQRNA